MIHKFKLFGKYIVLDVESGCVHILDKLSFEMLDLINFSNKKESLENILKHFKNMNSKEIENRLNELFSLYEEKMLFSSFDYKNYIENVKETKIKALCLHVAHDCNLRCRYCFASTGNFKKSRKLMPFETAKKAIDFLIEKSGNRRNLEVDFFGGEPLLNFDVIKKTVEYGKKIEKKYKKNLRFTLTTNGMLLTNDKIDYINSNMSNVILSLDGRKEINDKFRITENGNGSYDLILKNFLQFIKKRETKDYYVRGTFTKYNLDFFNDFIHFYNLGFKNISIEPVVCDENEEYAIKKENLPKIYEEYEKIAKFIIEKNSMGHKVNFFHFNIDLSQGPCLIKRLRGCGSGCEYFAISPEGDIYPCHQFVGEDEFFMGNLFENNFKIDLKEKFSEMNLLNKKDCQQCWAKYYCGGGCVANNAKYYEKNILKPYSIGCEMEKKRVEVSIAIKACLLEKENFK